MVRDDSEREQKCSADRCTDIVAPYRNHQRGRTEQDSKYDRHNDEVERPSHTAGQLKGEHTEIMHAGNTAADDTAADWRAPPIRDGGSNAETNACDGHCSHKRRDREPEVVGRRHPRLVG